MHKNYYDILEVSPFATQEEIRRAYRKLALQHHPDTATDITNANRKFHELQQAYKVLSNDIKRQEYHYKHFNFNYKDRKEVNADIILMESRQLTGLVKAINPHKIDFDALLYHLKLILSAHNIALLQASPEQTRHWVVKELLNCCQVLRYKDAYNICQQLLPLASPQQQQQISLFLSRKKRELYWNRYKVLLVLAVAVLFCVTIYFFGRNR